MLKNFFEVNDLISEKLQSNEPFSLLRLDNSAGYVLQNLFNNTSISSQFFNNTVLSFEGGITPGTTDYYIDTIVPMLTQSMKECDILGFVDMSLAIQNDTTFTKTFGEKPMFFGHDSLMVLDPIGVLRGGLCGTFKVETPWTKYLKNKKVLIISTHCETIKSQWQQIDKIWGDNLDLVAPFDLVGCIRTPYHPLMDDRQYPGCETWEQNVEYIKNEIDKYEYDVLISGASTSSPIYVEHAKKRGKVGIQTGGVHQLFFGILGHRWSPEANNGYRVWAEYYNEHWTYPFKEDEARNKNQVRHLEGNYAYWKP
jgi:hypothetical protein